MTVKEKECTRCKKTKPLKDFKRVLTLAQSRALLKRPNLRTPHETISAICKDCRPNKLTLKKIQNLVFDGDINAVTGDYLKIKIIQAGREAQANGMRKVWRKRKQEKIDAIVTPWHRNIRQQVVKKYNYYTATKARGADPYLIEHAKLDYEIARELKNGLFLRVKLGEGLTMDLYPNINDYYGAEHKSRLYQLWTQIPQDVRNKLRRAR